MVRISAEAEDVNARKKTEEGEGRCGAWTKEGILRWNRRDSSTEFGVIKFTKRAKKIERAEHIKETEKELKLPYLKEIFVDY